MASRARLQLALACAVLACGCGDDIDPGPAYSVIVYSRENMWIHASNPVASQALVDLERTHGWKVERASDPSDLYPRSARDD
jgi:hypothetical protein